MPTKKMTFALFCATKVDVRGLNLSFEEVSEMIGRCKKGETQEVRNELLSRGGKSNGEVKPKKDWQSVYDKAHQAGMIAARNCVPTPMVVNAHADVLDDSSPVIESYYVPQGPCGFAEIRFKGNTGFAKWAKKEGLADKSYDGGYYIWVGAQLEEFASTQSVEIKSAYASAFAKTLSENGVKAYSTSRLD